MLPPIVHVVRRYGCVGGMEKYVWELTHHLCEQGVSIEIVCETVTGIPAPRICIHKVPISHAKPRWKSMLNFRALVGEFLARELSKRKLIIHSHERSIHHHVTTFHGPPMRGRKVLWGIPWFNRRVCAWEKMECEEVLGPSVQYVLPVSSLVQKSLMDRYPSIGERHMELAWPGIQSLASEINTCLGLNKLSDHFVFVGTEWKRKGLKLAIETMREYRADGNAATLDVYGVVERDLPRMIRSLDWVECKGWVSDIPWNNYDVLIHPARSEPFGMVIAEARAAGVSVLVSDRVGATDMGYTDTAVVNLDAPLSEWVDALNDLVKKSNGCAEVKWTWDDLATLHHQTIYGRVVVE
jgi:UDP-glucose:(heptosyl)LPS alpha-1,3-glucosyltransferase